MENNTHIKGAIIATDPGGDLTLNTNTLTYEEIKDKNKGYDWSLSVSGSTSIGGVGFDKDANILGMKPYDYSSKPADGKGSNTDYVPSNISGYYFSHDKEGILRPTVTEGEIIVRSNPDAETDGSLDGLNRDIGKAREIIKDQNNTAVVYVSPGAIETVVELVDSIIQACKDKNKPLPTQLTTVESLMEEGLSKEEAIMLVSKKPVDAKVIGYLQQLGIDIQNLSEAEAQKVLAGLEQNVLSGTLGSGGILFFSGGVIPLNELEYNVYAALGAAKAAGLSAVDTLYLLNDVSGYALNKASGGLLFKEHAARMEKTASTVANVIRSLNMAELPPKVIALYESRYADIMELRADGQYDEAGLRMGIIAFELATVLYAAGASQKMISQVPELANFRTTLTLAEANQIRNTVFEVAESGGGLTGRITTIPKAADRTTIRALTRENESAALLAQRGYYVEQNPITIGSKNPDYKINGEIFDCLAPTTSSPRRVWTAVGKKLTKAKQTMLSLTSVIQM
ncbi:hypothetical protein [Desulfovibrio cuneatus]|uniref:CdiA C-terminal domain-containing protein n=1 Tax=Desulfovibrio cuneatus TaxID=159728 RepID=UPI0012EBB2A0|nr:hypothetical protein [Desulfovibrio cuneatus]